jgi:hypothetical protein
MLFLKYIVLFAISVVVFPFVLLSFLVSMLSLGIYYVSTALLWPVAMIGKACSLFLDGESDRKLLAANPLIVLSNKMLDIADWKI